MEDIYLSNAVLENILNGGTDPTNLPLPFLRYITKNFAKEQKIGSGRFSEVYKGEHKNRIVAVKRLFSEKTITEESFYQEVNNLMAVKHQNIVRFLGFCANTENIPLKDPKSQGKRYIYAEKRERLLCFEYISNGSLQSHLTDELRGLEWHIRYEIIKNICEGLRYLHEEKHMIHRDLKPDNVLLDDFMEPKIADLGISKLLDHGASKAITTNTWMSQGYCAPELRQRYEVSFKSDIYSLGVIIIELITGRKRDPVAKNVLRRWRYRWNKAKETTLSCRQVAKCIDIGLRCRNEDPQNRPSISKIISDLNKIDSASGQISNLHESADGQRIKIPCLNDLLWIEPLELFFPFEINKEMACSLHLINKTNGFIAFNIQTTSILQYCIQPHRGIVSPLSICRVNITLQAQNKALQDRQHPDEFVVKSTKVNEDLTVEDVTENIFRKERAYMVEEVNLDVVFDTHLRAPCIFEEPSEDLSGTGLYEPEASDLPQLTAHTGPGETNSEKISSSPPKKLTQVHPQEIRFPFLPSERLTASSGIKLVNVTDEYVAFVVRDFPLNAAEYITHPNTGIMAPWSTQELVVKRTAKKAVPQSNQCNDKYWVHSTAVSEGFKNNDLVKLYETQSGQIWHTMEMDVVLEEESQLQSYRSESPTLKNKKICSSSPKKLIEIHSHELHFPFLTTERLSPSSGIKLVNITDDYVAFVPWTSLLNVAWYFVHPREGIMPPRSTLELVITRAPKKGVPQSIQCNDKWYLYTTTVSEGFKNSNLRKFFETQTGQIWHNVELGVVLEAASELQCHDGLQHTEKISSFAPKKLIHVHPHELRFPFLPSESMSVSSGIKLVNITDDYVAFAVKTIIYNVAFYNFHPQEGILPPRSTQELVVKRTAKKVVPQSIECNDMCYVYSFALSEDIKNNNANKFYKQQAGQIWHNMELSIVLEEASQLKSSKPIMDLSLATQEIWDSQLMGQTPKKPLPSMHSVSTLDQIIQVDPLELILPLQPKEVEFSLKILNITDDYVAFRVRYTKAMAKLYGSKNIGILSPRSMFVYKNTRTSPEGLHADIQDPELVYLASTMMSKGFKMIDVTNDLFDKPAAGRLVHMLKLPVFLIASSGPLSWEVMPCTIRSVFPMEKQGDEKANDSNSQVSSSSSHELIQVDPLELILPLQPEEVEFSLKILNITDDYVAFRVRYTKAMVKLYRPKNMGILSPRSMFIFKNTRTSPEGAPANMQDTELVYLASTVVGKGFRMSDITHDLFDKPAAGGLVHTLKLPVFVVAPSGPQSWAVNSSMSPTDQPSKNKSGLMWVNSIDVHPTKPWIMTTQQDPYICIWNYQTQEVKRFFLGVGASQVTSVKFVAQEQWIVAGTSYGLIYLFSYEPLEQICFLRAHSGPVNSLAIHPTDPHVLSASFGGEVQLRDYEDGLGLIETFSARIWCARSVAFDPAGDTFASACGDSIKMWNLDSGECKLTLCGHSHEITCLEYFTREDELYLISGSQDRTAKIWDCETGRCVKTLHVYSPVRTVSSHPDLSILITGSYDGSVHIWNFTSFRHERVLKFDLGGVNAIACLKGSTRIAIAHTGGLALAEIGPEEPSE